MSRAALSPCLIILFLLTVAGCAQAPRPRIQLEAIRDHRTHDATWMGRPMIHRSEGDLDVEIGFLGQSGSRLGFELWISNQGPQPIEIRPELVHCLVYASESGAAPDTVWARDPEQVFLALDRREEKARQRQSNADMVDTAISLVGFIAEIASGEESQSGGPSWSESIEENQARFDEEMYHIDSARIWWEDYSLQRIILYTGESTWGQLQVPSRPGAGRLELVIPVGDQSVRFGFRQSKILPDKTGGW